MVHIESLVPLSRRLALDSGPSSLSRLAGGSLVRADATISGRRVRICFNSPSSAALVASFFMRGRIGGMKAISAAIIVLAGAVLQTVRGDLPNFIGFGLGCVGFVAWAVLLFRESQRPN